MRKPFFFTTSAPSNSRALSFERVSSSSLWDNFSGILFCIRKKYAYGWLLPNVGYQVASRQQTAEIFPLSIREYPLDPIDPQFFAGFFIPDSEIAKHPLFFQPRTSLPRLIMAANLGLCKNSRKVPHWNSETTRNPEKIGIMVIKWKPGIQCFIRTVMPVISAALNNFLAASVGIQYLRSLQLYLLIPFIQASIIRCVGVLRPLYWHHRHGHQMQVDSQVSGISGK